MKKTLTIAAALLLIPTLASALATIHTDRCYNKKDGLYHMYGDDGKEYAVRCKDGKIESVGLRNTNPTNELSVSEEEAGVSF